MIRDLFSVKPSARNAWTDVLIAIALNVTGMMMQVNFSSKYADVPVWPAYGSAVMGLILIVALLFYRRGQRLWIFSLIFLLNTLAVDAALYIRDDALAAYGAAWAPFQTNKLGSLIVALLAPQFWVGLAGIATHIGGAVVHLELLPAEIRANLPIGEPMATLAFGFAALLTLVSRFRRLKSDSETIHHQAASNAAKKLALTVLRLRDLMNTPLQIIEFSVSITRQKAGHEETALKSMENALERLNELNAHMKKYETDFDWSEVNESFEELEPRSRS